MDAARAYVPRRFPDFRFDSQPRFPDNYLIDGKQLGAESARGGRPPPPPSSSPNELDD